MKIHHLAVVVRSLRRAGAFYRRLGMDATKQFRVRERYPGDEREHVYLGRAFFDPAQGFPAFWLMQPLGGAGPLAKFLAKHGPGFHHVGLMCRGLARMRFSFVRPPHFFREDNETRALLDPGRTDGTLIELMERRFASPKDSFPPLCVGAADHVGVTVRRIAPYDRFFRFLGFAPDAIARDRAFRIARYRVRGFHVALFEPRQGEARKGFDHVALPLEGLGVNQVIGALKRARIPFRGPYPLKGETSIKLADPAGAEWELLVR